MIVKMQKITILVTSKDADNALGALRKLGVLHIEYSGPPRAERITATEDKISGIETALSIISREDKQRRDCTQEEVPAYIKEIITANKERESLLESRRKLEGKIEWFERWGNISPSSLAALEKANVFIKLYVVGGKLLKSIPDEKMVHIIKKVGGDVYLALVSEVADDRLDFLQIEIPDKDLPVLEKKYNEVNNQLEKIDNRLGDLSQYRESLLTYKDNLAHRLEFYKVRFGMAKEEGFDYLRGFCPEKDVGDINRLASKEGWAVLSETPDNPEEVPTLVKNPRWIEIINPVFKFIGTLPGYKEYDISLWFLLFFSIFFALLIGDAGYGLIFLLVTFLVKKKLKNMPREPLFLMFALSLATMIWGAITGNWFGFERIAHFPIFNSLVISKINSFISSNQIFVMYLSFLIGVIHLTIAHAIIAFRFINSLLALAHLGWVCILWGLFFVAGKIILNNPIPQIMGIIFSAGIVLVILFSHSQKNFFKGILLSLGDLPLKIVSSFSDIVSYVRLFAVGYASVIVATSFNNMALSIGFNSIFSGLIAVVVLFLGHSLNIVLGVMAVVVHGIRLNMLEFSGHLSMQWSGKEYRPFRM